MRKGERSFLVPQDRKGFRGAILRDVGFQQEGSVEVGFQGVSVVAAQVINEFLRRCTGRGAPAVNPLHPPLIVGQFQGLLALLFRRGEDRKGFPALLDRHGFALVDLTGHGSEVVSQVGNRNGFHYDIFYIMNEANQSSGLRDMECSETDRTCQNLSNWRRQPTPCSKSCRCLGCGFRFDSDWVFSYGLSFRRSSTGVVQSIRNR
jgi:hypothetical protein